MVLNWEKATKKQLLQIALYEDCPVDLQYRAVSQLQMKWSNTMFEDLVRLYGIGEDIWYIAEYLGTNVATVLNKINQYGLKRTG